MASILGVWRLLPQRRFRLDSLHHAPRIQLRQRGIQQIEPGRHREAIVGDRLARRCHQRGVFVVGEVDCRHRLRLEARHDPENPDDEDDKDGKDDKRLPIDLSHSFFPLAEFRVRRASDFMPKGALRNRSMLVVGEVDEGID